MGDRVESQLYLVSPPRFEPAGFTDSLRQALDGGPVACFQLWMPDADEDTIRQVASTLRPIILEYDTAFLLNGHTKLASFVGCDGVHLDDTDAKTIKAARKTLGDDAVVGVSCGSSRHTSMEAAEAGADYVSFGPVYATSTKGLDADEDALDTLSWWAEMMEVPCVAVGGITPDNLDPVLETRCEFICAVSAIWNHPKGPKQAVADFHAKIREAE
ncbi:thiamine phosphate synthase [Rhodospirillaceae bacterium KN72]|uniref:Thiamine phosphate synthase n=1 Tax=Pacificispira spongiicola TaxID=2729598 RepID=A0A7Y0DWN0_9PROT|nr:thiamine phosphate synthase [Pacificispira spongiicola]NMM42957.1 thiamine phosphate synthase [Pacificispira spongiicola]